MSDRSIARAERLLVLAVVVGCILSISLAIRRSSLPFQLDYEEGNVLNAAVRINAGGTPYPPLDKPPYVINPYGPIPYALTALAVRIAGVGFFAPRLLILAAGIAVAAGLAYLLFHFTRTRWLSFAFGVSFLSVPLVRGWLYLLRVDLIGLAFAIAGLCLFTHRRLRIFAAICFVAAVFCKYTMMAAPLACLSYLLVRRQHREAILFAASSALLGSLGFAVVQLWTDHWFAVDMFWTHPDSFSLAHMVPLIRPALQINSLLIVMALAYAVADLWRRELSLPALYFWFASAVSLTAGKEGSVQNHLLEWMAVVCLAAGLLYARLRNRPGMEPARAILVLALAFSILAGSPSLARVEPANTQCDAAYAYVKDHPGQHVVGENVGAVVTAGKPVFMSNPAVYGWLVKLSGWSDADLVSLIQSRYFDLVILSHELDYLQKHPSEGPWTERMLQVLSENYTPTRRFTCVDASVILEPRASRGGGLARR